MGGQRRMKKMLLEVGKWTQIQEECLQEDIEEWIRLC
jgi:hypothetical protein